MNQTGFLESAIPSLATFENSFLRLLNKSFFFEKLCSLKNVKDKVLSFLLFKKYGQRFLRL